MNADKIVNNSTDEQSQELFNSLIERLDESGILKDVMLDGSDHRTMTSLIKYEKDRFPLRISNKRGIIKLKDWWNYSKNFLEERANRAIILSIGGKSSHLTVIERMSNRTMFLKDSNWRAAIRRSICRLPGFESENMYLIYPAQCWFLGKE